MDGNFYFSCFVFSAHVSLCILSKSHSNIGWPKSSFVFSRKMALVAFSCL